MTKEEFDQALKSLEPDAIKALQRTLKDGGSPALKAAELLLAYTRGKPTQVIEAQGLQGVGTTVINVTYLAANERAPLVIDNERERIQ